MLGNTFPVLLVVVIVGILSRSSWVKTGYLVLLSYLKREIH